MAFEPVVREIETKYTKSLGKESIPVVLTLTSTEGGAITKVLAVEAQPCIDTITPAAGSAQFDGKICAQSLVSAEGDKFFAIKSTSNFTLHSMNAEIKADSRLFATSQLVEIQSIQASENSVTFTAIIEVEIIGLSSEDIRYIESIHPGAQQKIDTIEYTDIKSGITQNFDVSIELDLPNSISEVLFIESRGILRDVVPSQDIVTLRGEIMANLVYLTNDEQPKLRNYKYVQEFTQEVLVNGATADAYASASLNTCCTNYEIQGELTSAKGMLILKCEYKTNILISEKKSVQAVVDTFCPNYEFKPETSSYVTQRPVCARLFNEKVDGNIVLSEDSPRIDKVLASMCSNVVYNSVEIEDESVVIEGTVYSNVVYMLDDEFGTIQSVLAEIPFKTSVKCDNAQKGDIANVCIAIRELEARNKRSKEIDIIAELAIFVEVLRNDNGAALSNVNLGEVRAGKENTIGVYFISQANDVWDIAKSLLVPADLIMRQNPELTFPITSTQRVVVYREHQIEN